MQLSDAEQAKFRRMTQAPKLAWPTVMLFFACLFSLGGVYYFALTDQMPLWLAAIVNGLITYFFFSVVHDASHGAISSNKTLNDLFGQIGMLFYGPLATLKLARWIHMQHHRFTNDHDKDPDAFGHKLDVWAPLRWMNFDYYYTTFFLEKSGPMRQKFQGRLILQMVFVVSVVVVAFYFGYGWEAIMLWLVPTRISSALFVLCFVYLPHAPFKATSAEDEYKASNIRAGWEWLLTPLMTYQNYHLVHHLYPTAPFYRMLKLWNYRLAFHMGNNPYFVKTFSVGKENTDLAVRGEK